MVPQPPQAGGRPSDGTRKRKEPPAASDPSSRNAGTGDNPSHKRSKVRDARTVRSQPADAALKNGELDLQAFLSAREFEIRALTSGMQASKNVNNRRAFQLVPRGMRRRTASHNVKKLPKRLRARAAREKVGDNTPTVEARRRKPKTSRGRIRVEAARRLGILAEKKKKRRLRESMERAKQAAEGHEGVLRVKESAAMKQLIETRPARPKIRRNLLNDPPKPKAKFRKRQIDKTWLPTHLWHAKRAKMTPPKEPLWRFSIPLTPNEKVYRPTHRASTVKGVMVWDMSYMSTIGLYGHEAGIERTLRTLGMSHDSLWNDRGKRWREGRRKWSGILSKEMGDLGRAVGPAAVIWNPEKSTPQTSEEPQSTNKVERQVYIRLHPSCFLEIFNILTKLIKRETPRLYVEDLRFEIGSIELTGPDAIEALQGVIRPYRKDNEREVDARLFESLTTTATAVSLSSDAVLGFSTRDPRLSYPPRKIQAQTENTSQSDGARNTDTQASPPFLLFDRDARFKASRFPSQQSLNRRKGANPPGQPLEVSDADPPFPIILFSSRAKTSAQNTWTLLAPWKCILPIWYSLVHYPLSTSGNPRVGGMNELQQVTFEQGLPWFPGDFPGTDAGAEWELEQRQKRKADWARRPKSKRVAWESLDLGAGRKGEIGIGWACELERLFGLQSDIEPEQEDTASQGTKKATEVPVMSDKGKEADADHKEGDAGVGKPEAGSDDADHAKKEMPRHPLTLVHHISKAAFNKLASSNPPESRPPHSIVAVKITFPSRGVVKPCARIYRLPSRKINDQVSPNTQPEVPATDPPSQPKPLPSDLREQWLAKIPGFLRNQQPPKKKTSRPQRFPPTADHDAQKLLLAQSLVTNKVPFPPEKHASGDSDHPLVPNEEDLIGYVTKGAFSLTEGNGVAVGSVSVERALEALEAGGQKEGHVCIVRNAGEAVGWVGRWEVV